MKSLMKYYVLSALILGTFALYFIGCTSAESTTGKLAYQQKDYEKAARELAKGLLIDKTDDEGWYMLGHSQIEIGQFEEASKSFKTSLSISNKWGDYILSLWAEKFNDGARIFSDGISSEKKKDTSLSNAYYRKALNKFTACTYIIPDSIKAVKAAAECYLALGQNDKAMNLFTEVLNKSKNKEDAVRVAAVMFDAGLGMIKIQNYPAAIETFGKIIDIEYLPKDDPYYETSMYNYALSKAKIGEKKREEKPDGEEFKQYFREAKEKLEPLTISLKKKDLEYMVYELLVSVYANLGENQKATDALKKKEELEKNKK